MDTVDNWSIVDTKEALAALIPVLVELPVHSPSLFIDLEGYNLCRKGSVSLITLHAAPLKKTFFIDVLVLGPDAFTVSEGEWTLKRILEDEDIPKVFFDCRNDSDALYNLFQVDMKGVKDVQLMELATRPGRKRFLNGLARTIEGYAGLNPDQLEEWKKVKEQGKDMFNNSETAVVVEQRPLDPVFLKYSVQDVVLLPKLYCIFDLKLNNKWRPKVENEVFWRLQYARQANYFGEGRDRALGPW
ncbi:hypothetical protein FRC02_008264 [Tulasnella sp. 418]|nr:hypothetical protein FRC02_008264 [Tulasnella sp. 418]